MAQKVTAPALLPGAVALHGLYGVSLARRAAGGDVRPGATASVPRDRGWGAPGQRSREAEQSVEIIVAQCRVRLASRPGLVSWPVAVSITIC